MSIKETHRGVTITITIPHFILLSLTALVGCASLGFLLMLGGMQ